ncbi:MAG: tetratricopeptide repeat protein [Myxococcales bacterium]|nr:tetratricopeptide repeat protein [Myxococcales bacterium]
MKASDGAGAMQDLDAALYAAVRLGHSEVAAEAATKRLYTMQWQLGRAEDAARELAMTEALVGRERGDPRLLWLFHNNAGSLLAGLTKVEETFVHYDAALAAAERAHGTREHPDYAVTLMNMGIARAVRDPASAARDHARALEIFERALGPQHPYVATAQLNLGIAELEGDLLDVAGEHLGAALQAFERTYDERANFLAHPLTALAERALATRSSDAAAAYGARALAVLRHNGLEASSNAYGTLRALALAEAARGHHDEARACGERVVAIAESSFGSTHWLTGEALALRGELARTRGEHDAALTALDGALAIFQGDPRRVSARPARSEHGPTRSTLGT